MPTNKTISTRREKLAGYFFDLSKLSFAGLVIGSLSPIFSGSSFGWFNGAALACGAIATLAFAIIGNKTIK